MSLGLILLLNACVLTPSPITVTSTSLPSSEPTLSTVSAEPSRPSPTPTPQATKPLTATPTESQVCRDTKGSLVAGEFESQLLGKTFNFQIYLPACFTSDPEQRYPVVYLLHGLYTNETQWDLIGLADAMDSFIEMTETPFLVVMPRVPDSDAQAASPIHQVIPEELVPFIDEHYSTHADRDHRAIGGVSRGASLSLRIGYERRDLFGKIGMHSLPMLIDESTSYAKALGKLENSERPLLFLDSGNNDRDLAMARTFDLELTKLAIPHTWYMFNGYHEVAYWSEHLPIYLEWYAQGW